MYLHTRRADGHGNFDSNELRCVDNNNRTFIAKTKNNEQYIETYVVVVFTAELCASVGRVKMYNVSGTKVVCMEWLRVVRIECHYMSAKVNSCKMNEYRNALEVCLSSFFARVNRCTQNLLSQSIGLKKNNRCSKTPCIPIFGTQGGRGVSVEAFRFGRARENVVKLFNKRSATVSYRIL